MRIVIAVVRLVKKLYLPIFSFKGFIIKYYKTGNGPLDTNCLTCATSKYLKNGECVTDCGDGILILNNLAILKKINF